MAALCVLASGLIALRFGLGNGLDLRAPITQFLIEDQAAAQNAKKASGGVLKSQKQWMQEAESLLSKLGMAPKPGEPAPGDPDALEKALEQALENPAEASAKNEKGSGADKGGQAKEGASADESPGDPLDNGEESKADQTGSEGKESKPGDKGSKASTGKSANSGNKESLLARLKDAVSNMLSKSDEKLFLAEGPAIGEERFTRRRERAARERRPAAERKPGRRAERPTGRRRAERPAVAGKVEFESGYETRPGRQRDRQPGWFKGNQGGRATEGDGEDQRDHRAARGDSFGRDLG